MSLSLRWRILWAPAVTVVLGGITLWVQQEARVHTRTQASAAIQMRERLDKLMLRLRQRHDRSVRRAREAMLEQRPNNRLAILSWTSDHYLAEMERHLRDGSATLASIGAIEVLTVHPRLQADLSRLSQQMDRILGHAGQAAKSLDLLLEAVAAEDSDMLLAATYELDRADRAVQGSLRVAEAIARRAATWQARRAAQAPLPYSGLIWLPFAVWGPISLLVAFLPIRRVLRWVHNGPGSNIKPRSSEEQILAAQQEAAQRKQEELVQLAEDRQRESARAGQSARRAEHELALLRLYNENLVNSLRAAIVVTDGAGQITAFNRAARRLLGLADEALGSAMSTHALYGSLKSRSRDVRADLDRTADRRLPLRHESVPYVAPQVQGSDSPQEALLDLTIAPYLDESGAARGLLWVADDVTDAVRTKNQLLAAERLAAVGRLSAQVAHEIRNPLSAIGLNTELLEEELAESPELGARTEARQLLSGIAAEVERLTHVTQVYLQLARLPRPAPRAVDLSRLIGDLLTMLSEELKTHNVVVELDLGAPAATAWVDPGQLRQALLNIIRNSREAMTNGGQLRLAARTLDGCIEIMIADTGEGIADEVLPRIFEPFYSTKPDGTGLGLSLTKQILSENGGSIEVTSEPRSGTVTCLRLPRALDGENGEGVGPTPADDALHDDDSDDLIT